MGKHCYVAKCSNSFRTSKDTSYFKFPSSEDLAKKWMNVLGPDIKINQYTLVCENHFSKDSIIKYFGRKKMLKAGTVPVKKNTSPMNQCKKQPSTKPALAIEDVHIDIVTPEISYTQVESTKTTVIEIEEKTPSSIDNVGICDGPVADEKIELINTSTGRQDHLYCEDSEENLLKENTRLRNQLAEARRKLKRTKILVNNTEGMRRDMWVMISNMQRVIEEQTVILQKIVEDSQ